MSYKYTMENINQNILTDIQKKSLRWVVVNEYNLKEMTLKNWNFFIAGRKIINKKDIREALRIGIKNIKAEYKHKL